MRILRLIVRDMSLPDPKQLLDDLTRPGIEVPEAGDRRPWLSRCATAVRAGSVREVDALAALLEGDSEVAQAFRAERYWPGARGAAEDGSGGPRISAARAILDPSRPRRAGSPGWSGRKPGP